MKQINTTNTETERPLPSITKATHCILIEILHKDLSTSETQIFFDKEQKRGYLNDGTNLMEYINMASTNIVKLDPSAIGFRSTGYYLNDENEWISFFRWHPTLNEINSAQN